MENFSAKQWKMLWILVMIRKKKMKWKLAKQIVEKLNAKGLNILTNTNEVAGQTVHHFHVHILPRYDEKELVIEFNDHSQDVDLDEVYQKIVK